LLPPNFSQERRVISMDQKTNERIWKRMQSEVEFWGYYQGLCRAIDTYGPYNPDKRPQTLMIAIEAANPRWQTRLSSPLHEELSLWGRVAMPAFLNIVESYCVADSKRPQRITLNVRADAPLLKNSERVNQLMAMQRERFGRFIKPLGLTVRDWLGTGQDRIEQAQASGEIHYWNLDEALYLAVDGYLSTGRRPMSDGLSKKRLDEHYIWSPGLSEAYTAAINGYLKAGLIPTELTITIKPNAERIKETGSKMQGEEDRNDDSFNFRFPAACFRIGRQ
jgi:hypothetical protein